MKNNEPKLHKNKKEREQHVTGGPRRFFDPPGGCCFRSRVCDYFM